MVDVLGAQTEFTPTDAELAKYRCGDLAYFIHFMDVNIQPDDMLSLFKRASELR